MSYNLFLDDKRDPPNDGKEWKVARSYLEAVRMIQKYGFPEYVSFDHDLGGEHTGYDFAKYLTDYDFWNQNMPEAFNFYVHSQNPVGRENITRYLEQYIAHRDFFLS